MKSKKYDIIIYGCLIGAVICVILGCGDYLLTLKDEGISFSKQETEVLEEAPTTEEEPDIIKNADKNSIVTKYLDSILDQIVTSELISYDMISSWENYEVINTTYEREIVESYYSYLVDIKINNLNAILPTGKNKELSTEDYLVISLRFNIAYNASKNGFIVKSVDIPA